MEITIRAYTAADTSAAILIWNQVVEAGVAFPQMETLTEQSGAAFAAVSMELLDLQAAGLVATDQAQRYYRK